MHVNLQLDSFGRCKQ